MRVASGSTLSMFAGAAAARATGAATVSTLPSYTAPLAPSTVTNSPSRRIDVALRAPTTQGTPSSRDTIAAWHVMPPPSVTTAAARRIVGTQSGLVIGATSTSPRSSRLPSCGVCKTRTRPLAVPADAARPRSSGSAAPAVSLLDASVEASVVIGRDCTR